MTASEWRFGSTFFHNDAFDALANQSVANYPRSKNQIYRGKIMRPCARAVYANCKNAHCAVIFEVPFPNYVIVQLTLFEGTALCQSFQGV
jgi:hypothetical protein